MAPLPTVRKYQAEAGAVGQSFLQRSGFSNPAFEATGAHVASLTWRFFNKHLLSVLTSSCQKYGVTGTNSWKCTSAFHISRAAWIPPEVWRLKSKWFGHSVSLHPQSMLYNLYAKFNSLEIKQLIERVVLCCIFSVFQYVTPNLEIRWP
jgi:hypothetical protein